MEISNIPSKLIKIGNLKKMYASTLPKEYYIPQQSSVEDLVDDEFQNRFDDPLVYEQLKHDCNLENLYFDGEYSTLEEVLRIIPRKGVDEKALSTLDCLQKEACKLNSKASILHVLQRVPRPIINLSYRNCADESSDTTELIRDIYVTVMVYRPFCLSLIDQCTHSRQLVVTQQLVLLGSQNLTTLRDAIKCPQDKIWLGDCSEALDDTKLHVTADKLYPSSYFFIENTFYDDLRHPASHSLSKPVLEWAKSKQEMGQFKSQSMDSIDLNDLAVCVGKPYYFVHQGNCEHMIIFSDLRLSDRESCQNPSNFPMLIGRCNMRSLHCSMCRRLACRWLVSNCQTLLPCDPCPLCDVCIRHLLYTKEGKKIYPDFRVHMYCGEEIVM